MGTRRIAVVGAGITGAAAAHRLVTSSADVVDEVVLFERDERVGGRIDGGPFAGLDSVDAGADAFLARVPDAVGLAHEVGLGDDLVHPEKVGAAVWFDGFHDIPEGLVLGVPGNPLALARSGLLTWRGKARAAAEPLLPRTSTEHDSIGRYVRARFGDEVHERLVDALVGSIYAADTDRFSLAEVPQLAALTEDRSLLLGARRIARRNAGTASADAAPIFATPRGGMRALATATVASFESAGGSLRSGTAAEIRRVGAAWEVGGERFDAVICTLPSDRIDAVVHGSTPIAPTETMDRADVVMVTLHVSEDEFPERFRGRSGYLVPKPVQRHVTAVSFGSQKWAHWRPPSGGEILRVSLGRDGAPILHLDDDEIVGRTLDDLRTHLGVALTPVEVRVSRWPGAFAQYRPHHRHQVEAIRSALDPGLFVAGSSYDGIGIPACVRSGRGFADCAVDFVEALAT
ncbi:protoporphyrinogen oxidase [Ilumatobacter nonamiensis]|uniref:protoporphyrinogen oxidase n=1 Tax=Ilumatobacter nonamiensis TaxID=467093 RepID=UPI00068424A9|nr:protoporphyrinogen oxidase [Ilumatobacter nonamiensis]